MQLLVVAGPASTTDGFGGGNRRDIDAAAAGPRVGADRRRCRCADRATGSQVFPVVVPALPPTRCDDWSDFVLQLGGIPAIDDGTLLARSVRAYFANGGARCHVATIRRPRFDDAAGMDAAHRRSGRRRRRERGRGDRTRAAAAHLRGRDRRRARSLRPQRRSRRATLDLPPRDVDACFRRCDDTLGVRARASARLERTRRRARSSTTTRCSSAEGDAAALRARALARAAAARRAGRARSVDRACFAAPTPIALDGLAPAARHTPSTISAASCGAFYHPWALTQEKLGAPIVELPPTALAAGIIARRDLARGPHIAPANERLIGVVGLSPPVDDDDQRGDLRDAAQHQSAARASRDWACRCGARARSRPIAGCATCRCGAASRRSSGARCAALRPLVFEPNTPTLWFQITQAVLGVLVPIFNAGALRGDTAEQAFYVRCDDTNNPPETIAAGQVLCEVGVAIAAPAEFIVFRVGRREAVVEVLE